MIDNRTAPYAALVLRLALSFFFFAHLVRKFAVIGFDPWWAGLVKQGYPGVVLAYTVAIEFAGALLLLLGVYTRYVSLLSLPVLIAVANHWMVRKGFWFADGGMEFPLAWVFMLIAQVLLGDGAPVHCVCRRCRGSARGRRPPEASIWMAHVRRTVCRRSHASAIPTLAIGKQADGWDSSWFRPKCEDGMISPWLFRCCRVGISRRRRARRRHALRENETDR